MREVAALSFVHKRLPVCAENQLMQQQSLVTSLLLRVAYHHATLLMVTLFTSWWELQASWKLPILQKQLPKVFSPHEVDSLCTCTVSTAQTE